MASSLRAATSSPALPCSLTVGKTKEGFESNLRSGPPSGRLADVGYPKNRADEGQIWPANEMSGSMTRIHCPAAASHRRCHSLGGLCAAGIADECRHGLAPFEHGVSQCADKLACAREAHGHVIAVPPRRTMKSRRFIAFPFDALNHRVFAFGSAPSGRMSHLGQTLKNSI